MPTGCWCVGVLVCRCVGVLVYGCCMMLETRGVSTQPKLTVLTHAYWVLACWCKVVERLLACDVHAASAERVAQRLPRVLILQGELSDNSVHASSRPRSLHARRSRVRRALMSSELRS